MLLAAGSRRALVRALTLVLVAAAPAAGQTNGQFWGTFTWTWLKSSRLTYDLELEPKVLVSAPEGEPGWASLEVVPNVQFAARRWLDLVGEMATATTKQTDDVSSFELAPRVGFRLHMTTRELPVGPLMREEIPGRRLVLRNLLRVEFRNLFYSDDRDDDSVVRLRNRLELQVPLNRARVNEDGAYYLLTDWEWFVPLDDPTERFANRQRIRTGLGYRRNVQWRFEALYIWTRSRDTTDQGFTTSDNIVNLRVKRVF